MTDTIPCPDCYGPNPDTCPEHSDSAMRRQNVNQPLRAPNAYPPMDLYDFQGMVARWAAITFPNSTAYTKLLHLLEEVDELIKAEAAYGDVESEAADILLILLHYAESRGFSLMAAALAKFEVVKARKWGPPDAHGVVRHEE